MTTRATLARYFGIGLIGLVLLGCTGDSEASAEEQLCDDLGGLRSALSGMAEAPEDGISRESLSETRDEVSGAVESVEESAADVADARTADLRATWDALRDAIESDIQSDDAPRTVLSNVRDEFDAFLTELTSVETSTNCDGAGE